MALRKIDEAALTEPILAVIDLLDQSRIEWCLLDALKEQLETMDPRETELESLQMEQNVWLCDLLDQRIGKGYLREAKILMEQVREMLVG